MKTYESIMVLLIIALCPCYVFSQTSNSPDRQQSMKGLEGIYVQVNLNSDIKEAGFSEAAIKNEVETKLRIAGLTILNEQEIVNTPGKPYFQITTFGYKMSTGGYVCAILAGLKQDVLLIRDTSIETEASTWSSMWEITFSEGNMYHLGETVLTMVDQFTKDYLAVNPKN